MRQFYSEKLAGKKPPSWHQQFRILMRRAPSDTSECPSWTHPLTPNLVRGIFAVPPEPQLPLRETQNASESAARKHPPCGWFLCWLFRLIRLMRTWSHGFRGSSA